MHVTCLLEKTKLDTKLIDEVIWGSVVTPSSSPNVAREIVLDLNLPKTIPGVTVSRACISGLQAIIQAVQSIEHGDAECIIAGGGDSMSNAELKVPRHVTRALANYQYHGQKRGAAGMLQLAKEAGLPTTWKPVQPAIAERSTGRTMGYHADLMAEINAIPRPEQDAFAIASHKKAYAAQQAGFLAEEITPVPVGKGAVSVDNIVRGQQDANKAAALKPVFRKNGTVTAASSSPLTDGASCVLVMSEEMAKRLGYPTDISLRSFATTAIDPYPQLLLAPAIAIPRALERAGISLDDVDIVEMHEAFAAQCLATIKCLASAEFASAHLGRSTPVGTLPMSKINPNGSSIAIGHPFAATGGRIVTAAMNELRRKNKRYALLSVCAAGGMGTAVVIERR